MLKLVMIAERYIRMKQTPQNVSKPASTTFC